MKICYLCDLRLPDDENAIQYRALDWAVSDIIKKMPDRIVCAGETALGECARAHLEEKLLATGINFSFEETADGAHLSPLDPDSADGQSPCITYYDTDTKVYRKAYWFSPVPTDLYNYFGAVRRDENGFELGVCGGEQILILPISDASEEGGGLDAAAERFAGKLNEIECEVVVAIENAGAKTPDECAAFLEKLLSKCKHKAGLCFNMTAAHKSGKHPVSAWLSALGKDVVCYRINTPVTGVYDGSFGLVTLYKCWSEGLINKAPILFDEYKTTMEAFESHRKRTVFDIHSHTRYSDCGRDDPHDLIDTAIKNGLSILGISDHNYGIGSRKPEYIKEIRALSKEYEGKIKLLCGIELSTLPHLYDLKSADEIAECDYCLLEHIAEPQSIVGGNLLEFSKQIPVRCGLAHTDLFAYCDAHGYNYEKYLKQMAECGIFWEMNVTYDSIHRYYEHPYVKDFMADKKKIELVKCAGLYVSVGFDSHRHEDYDGYKVHAMYDFLKEHGINTVDELF